MKKVSKPIVTRSGIPATIIGINFDNRTLSVAINTDETRTKIKQINEVTFTTALKYKYNEKPLSEKVMNSWLNEGNEKEETAQPVQEEPWGDPPIPDLTEEEVYVLLAAYTHPTFIETEKDSPGKGQGDYYELFDLGYQEDKYRILQENLKNLQLVILDHVLDNDVDGLISPITKYIFTPLGYRTAEKYLETRDVPPTPQPPQEEADGEDKPKKGKRAKILDPENKDLVYIPDLEDITGISGRKLRRILRNMGLNKNKQAHTWVWDRNSEEWITIVNKLKSKGDR